MKKIHQILKYKNNGFTLMEVMVSVTIFTIIVTIGMGSLMTIFKTLQKTRADRQTIDSISYVLDTMTRRIRTGSNYEVTSRSEIKFKDQEGIDVSFYYSDIDKRLYMIDRSSNQDDPLDITPANFVLQDFTIEQVGADSNDGIQPLIKINLVGFVKSGQQQSRLAVQTLISQRLLDFSTAVSGDTEGGSGLGGVIPPGADNLLINNPLSNTGNSSSLLPVTTDTMQLVTPNN